MRFVLYFASILSVYGPEACLASARSGDPVGIEALKKMFNGDPSKESSVPKCLRNQAKDEAYCSSNLKVTKAECEKANAHVLEVSDASGQLISAASTKDAGRICKEETAKMAEAFDLAKRVCEECAKGCREACDSKNSVCRGTSADQVQCNIRIGKVQVDSCGIDSNLKSETILKKSKEFADYSGESIATSLNCKLTEDNSQDTPQEKDPVAENNDDGGGQQEQSQQQQAQNEDAGGDDTEEETKKDDKAAGGAGGMDPSAMMDKLMGKEEEEKDIECSKEEQPHLIEKCLPDVVKACTSGDPNVINTAGCKSFSSHYCYSGKAEGSGAGAGTDFCSSTLQKNFCADPTRARTCAGCLAQSAVAACGTAGSPVGCSADTSCSVAKNAGPLCTGDPYLLSSNYISSCVSAMATGTAGFSNSTPVTGLSGASSGGGGGLGGMGTASAAATTEAEPDETGNREGLNLGVESQGGYSAASSGGDFGDEGSSGGGSSKGRMRSRSVAAAGGGASMPTDVSSTHGPNTFSIISSVLKVRCNSFKHLHCEPQ